MMVYGRNLKNPNLFLRRNQMKNYKKILKSDKGSITTIVLGTILFIITILSTAYAITATLRKSQLKSQITTKDVYSSDLDNINQIYNSLIQ